MRLRLKAEEDMKGKRKETLKVKSLMRDLHEIK